MMTLTTRCCIVGGGPAGIMLGYLLARAGVEVIVIEKYGDFFRDFRGDTIHPSTMDNLHELGLLDKFLSLPHQMTKKMTAHIGDEEITVADFSYLGTKSRYIAFVPQWDFLTFISAEAKKFETFTLLMQTEATELILDKGAVVGIQAKGTEGDIEIRAELVIGSDGRHSVTREKAGLRVVELGSPIDVLWFKLSAREIDPEQSFGFADHGKVLIALDRGEYWQCAYLIAKGAYETIREQGLEKFRFEIARLAPFLSPSVVELKDWEQVKLLSVTVDRVEEWQKDGLLLIGDAAHAMSPIGGVGINLAIQDAIASANVLVPAFRAGKPTTHDTRKVQERRYAPTKRMQKLQVFLQNKMLLPFLSERGHVKVPFFLRLFQWIPPLRAIPANIIGLGFRPERIKILF